MFIMYPIYLISSSVCTPYLMHSEDFCVLWLGKSPPQSLSPVQDDFFHVLSFCHISEMILQTLMNAESRGATNSV